jgi:hypothetical protein
MTGSSFAKVTLTKLAPEVAVITKTPVLTEDVTFTGWKLRLTPPVVLNVLFTGAIPQSAMDKMHGSHDGPQSIPSSSASIIPFEQCASPIIPFSGNFTGSSFLHDHKISKNEKNMIAFFVIVLFFCEN